MKEKGQETQLTTHFKTYKNIKKRKLLGKQKHKITDTFLQIMCGKAPCNHK